MRTKTKSELAPGLLRVVVVPPTSLARARAGGWLRCACAIFALLLVRLPRGAEEPSRTARGGGGGREEEKEEKRSGVSWEAERAGSREDAAAARREG